MIETTTTQNAFTSMKGHVKDSNTVRMNDGSVCTLKQNSYGWLLHFDSGETWQLGFSAMQVEYAILNSSW